MKRIVRTTIAGEDAGRELLRYLCARFTYHDQIEWKALIGAGRIHLNACPASPDTVLRGGDTIEYQVQNIPEPPVSQDYSVLYDDSCLMAVDKPGNLPCHPAGPFFKHTLWACLKRDFDGLVPRFVSRLDRETSGIVLVAKTPAGQRKCQELGKACRISKIYTALVEGEFPDSLWTRGFITWDTGSAVRKKMRFVGVGEDELAPDEAPAEAKECETQFRLLEQAGELSLVEARLVTGRHHQIRATLCSLGYPVVGDKLYGVDDTCFLRFIEGNLTEADRRRLRLPRQALHATKVRLPHPDSGETLDVRSPVPKAFYEVLHGALAP